MEGTSANPILIDDDEENPDKKKRTGQKKVKIASNLDLELVSAYYSQKLIAWKASPTALDLMNFSIDIVDLQFDCNEFVAPIFTTMPEFKGPVQDFRTLQDPKLPNAPNVFVLGGFGALGNASSFHHPEIRKLRLQIYEQMLPFFRQKFPGPGTYIQMLFDRLCVRRKGTSTTAEAWHRDVGIWPNSKPDDLIFGGWVNMDLDNSEQHFTCIPGDIYNPHEETGNSFSKIDEEIHPFMEDAKKIYTIRPNHLILFNQRIGHKISPNKSKQTSFRLFVGWRISSSAENIYPLEKLNQWISDQAVPLLPSNMPVPMYAKLHWTNNPDLLVTFAESLIPTMCEDKVVQSGNNKGRVYRIPLLNAPSLKTLQLSYHAYTDQEKAIFSPRLLHQP